ERAPSAVVGSAISIMFASDGSSIAGTGLPKPRTPSREYAEGLRSLRRAGEVRREPDADVGASNFRRSRRGPGLGDLRGGHGPNSRAMARRPPRQASAFRADPLIRHRSPGGHFGTLAQPTLNTRGRHPINGQRRHENRQIAFPPAD